MRDDSASIYKGKLPESIFFILIFTVLWSAMWCVCLCVRTCMCVCLSLWLICVSVCACGLSVWYSSSSSYLVPFASRLAYLFSFLMLLSFIATRQVLSTTQTTHLPHTHTHTHTQQWEEAKCQQPLKMITEFLNFIRKRPSKRNLIEHAWYVQ